LKEFTFFETQENSVLGSMIIEPFAQLRFRQILQQNILEDKVVQEGQCNLAAVVLYQAEAFDPERPLPSQND